MISFLCLLHLFTLLCHSFDIKNDVFSSPKFNLLFVSNSDAIQKKTSPISLRVSPESTVSCSIPQAAQIKNELVSIEKKNLLIEKGIEQMKQMPCLYYASCH
jgi:hypothetical protein